MTNMKKLMVTIKYMMKHPVNRMQVPVLTAVAGISLIILCAYWLPAWISHSSVKSKITQAKQMIQDSKNSQMINDAYTQSSETVSVIQKKLASQSTTGDIISKINELARINKMALSIENSNNKDEVLSGYELSVLDISVRGSYQGFRSFISGLEKFDSMIVMRRVKIEREPKQGGMVKAAVKTAIYRKTSRQEGLK